MYIAGKRRPWIEAIDLTCGPAKVVGRCMVSGKRIELLVDEAELNAWNNGEYIQKAFPTMSIDDREWLISGISGEEFDKMFQEE